MGRYINWEDVVDRYSKYADVKDSGEANDGNIAYAENYVDMGLASSFSVPFSNNNIIVRDLSIDVAFAKILMFKDSEKADMILSHVNSVMAGLRDGVLTMITNSGDVIAQQGEPVYSKTMDYTPVFGHGDIEDFKVSSSQLYDEQQERDNDY